MLKNFAGFDNNIIKHAKYFLQQRTVQTSQVGLHLWNGTVS